MKLSKVKEQTPGIVLTNKCWVFANNTRWAQSWANKTEKEGAVSKVKGLRDRQRTNFPLRGYWNVNKSTFN